VERILTSGGESTCLEGLDVLASLVQKAGDRVTIVPGGGITERNIQRILRFTSPYHPSKPCVSCGVCVCVCVVRWDF
jgi:copper homeostasis protein